MLNLNPGASVAKREDLPIFTASANVDKLGGQFYITPAGLDENFANAIVFDNSGQRWLHGLRVFCGILVPTAKALSVTPLMSTDGGSTWAPLSGLGVAVSNTKRGAIFLPLTSLISMPDQALVIFRVTLSAAFACTLSTTLYAY